MSGEYGPTIRENIELTSVNSVAAINTNIRKTNNEGVTEPNVTDIHNFDISIDNLMSDIDGFVKSSVKDPNKDIQYMKVMSQMDYNSTFPNNDTLYFINNVEEFTGKVGHVVDMIADNKSIWILTYEKNNEDGVGEKEKIILWKAVKANKIISTNGFVKIKTWKGFKDGRLTLDGIWEFDTDENFAPILNTFDEPFVVLISTAGELFAFPSLKFEVDNLNEIDSSDNKIIPFKIAGNVNDNEIVTHVSLEKGYCSERYKENDQGIVVIYILREQGLNSMTSLRYRRYKYFDNDTSSKLWSLETTIRYVSNLFSAEIRRLSDYRLGIVYNCKEVDSETGSEINASYFIYSNRNYSGTAIRSECFEVPYLNSYSKPIVIGIDRILYGAVRNDNIDEVPTVNMSIDGPLAVTTSEINNNHLNIDRELTIEELAGLSAGFAPSKGRKGQEIFLVFRFFADKVSENELKKPLTFEVLNEDGNIIGNDGLKNVIGNTFNGSMTDTTLSLGNILIEITNDYPYETDIYEQDPEWYTSASKAIIRDYFTIDLYQDVEVENDVNGNKKYKEKRVGTALLVKLWGAGGASGRLDDVDFYTYWNGFEKQWTGPAAPFSVKVSTIKKNTDIRIRFLANDLCKYSEYNYEMGNYFCLDDVNANFSFNVRKRSGQHSVGDSFIPIGVGDNSYGVKSILENFGCIEKVIYGRVRPVPKTPMPVDYFSSARFCCQTNEVVAYPNDDVNNFNIQLYFNSNNEVIGNYPTPEYNNLSDILKFNFSSFKSAIGKISEDIDV